mmetsp:Transcript_61159/g.144442  ORF Transcript_61159/g.144442 Transcript_61159/m.144442 type:complete len:285 (-) Transcript_61159:471-1325(-)
MRSSTSPKKPRCSPLSPAGWRRLERIQPVHHQFQPQQRVVHRHQTLALVGRHGQQLGPAVGQPAGVIPLVGRLHRQLLRRGALGQAGQQIPQLASGRAQVLRHGHRRIGRQALDIGHPEAVAEAARPMQTEAFAATGSHQQQAGLDLLDMLDAGQRADVVKGLPLKTLALAPPDLVALDQGHHAEGLAPGLTAPHHVEIARLEDAQRQQTAGEQHRSQREQGRLGIHGGLSGSCRPGAGAAAATWPGPPRDRPGSPGAGPRSRRCRHRPAAAGSRHRRHAARRC